MATGLKILCFGRTGTGKTAAIASLLKTNQKVRVLSADNNAEAGIRAGFEIHKVTPMDDNFAVCIPDRGNSKPEDFLAYIDKALKQDFDVRLKEKDPTRKYEVGFRNIYSGMVNFIDTTGVDRGYVPDWGTDTTLVIDSLSVIVDEITKTLVGNGSLTQPLIGEIQKFVINVIQLLTGTLKCNIILLGHPTKEVDPVTGVTGIYPMTIGYALNERIGSFFSDVLYSQFDSTSKDYFWSTQHRVAVANGRNVPKVDKMKQDYSVFFKEQK